MVKQEPVNMNHQMILSVIPWVNLFAFARVQKLGIYIAIMLSVFLVVTGIMVGLIITSIIQNSDNIETPVNLYADLMENWSSPLGNVLSYTISAGINLFLIRRWSKDWNKKIETGYFEEQLKTIKKSPEQIEETPKLYVRSQWKKPNIYFTIPSIYLFISAGILLIGTIVKINDDYFLLSITYGLHLIILSVPSVIGAILLWRRKKIGLIFSNIALVFLSLILPTSIFGMIQYLPISDLDFISEETGIIFGLSIGLSILMMLFLSKAKKQVKWNKQFSENNDMVESK